jgi:hypothetical protein
MGFQHFIMDHVSGVFSKFAYSGWIAYRVKLLKRYFLEKSMGSTDLGKLNLVDNLLDGTIMVVWLMRMLDFLEVQTGFAVKVSDAHGLMWCDLCCADQTCICLSVYPHEMYSLSLV